MNKIKILITGANGQVGRELSFLQAEFEQFDCTILDRKTFDISNNAHVDAIFAKKNFDYVVNTAAYTAVDKAETEVELAENNNAFAVEYLAKACKKANAVLIHLSTDYVYHGSQNTPFVETDAVNPQSVYAATKLKGEELAMQHCPQTMVIRTSWVYSSVGNNFVKTMLRLGAERPELGIVFDQIGTPTYARDLANAIFEIIEKTGKDAELKSKMYGVFHYSNEGVTSWYDFAKTIFELENMNLKVNPITSAQFPTPAKRPTFSVLNKTKIKTTFGIEIPYWKDSLVECLGIIDLPNPPKEGILK